MFAIFETLQVILFSKATAIVAVVGGAVGIFVQWLRSYLSNLPAAASEAATRVDAVSASWRNAILARWSKFTQSVHTAFSKMPKGWWQLPVILICSLAALVPWALVVAELADRYGWQQLGYYVAFGVGALVVVGLVWMIVVWLFELLTNLLMLIGKLVAWISPVVPYLVVGGLVGWVLLSGLDRAGELAREDWVLVGAALGLAVFFAWQSLRLLFRGLLFVIRKLWATVPVVLLLIGFPAVGGAVGLVWGVLTPTIELTQPHSAVVSIVVGVTLVALGLMLNPQPVRAGRFLLVMVLSAAAIGLWTAYLWDQLPTDTVNHAGDGDRLATWLLLGVPALLAAFPFVQMAFSDRELADGQARFSYRRWYNFAFNNMIRMALAIGFAVVIYILLGLCGRLLDITQFKELAAQSRMPPVPQIAIGVALGLGMVGLEHSGLDFYQAVQRLGVLVGAVVLVALAVFALSYLSILPVAGLEPLWQTDHATPILLGVTAAMALALNLMRRDGTDVLRVPRWLRYGVELTLTLLPIFPAIAMYSVSVRIAQYGLTPGRMWALVLSGVALIYLLGVAASVWYRRGEWLSMMNRVNLTLAAAAVPLVLAMHSPWLGPIRWSVDSQSQRLLAKPGAFEEFDFHFLHNRLGRAGQERFEELKQLQDHPHAAAIRDAIATYLRDTAAGKLWPPSRRDDMPNQIRLLQPGRALPSALRGALQADAGWFAMCDADGVECIAVATDIIAGGVDEYCVVTAFGAEVHPSHSRCYVKDYDSGGWRHFGQLLGERNIPLHEFEEQLRAGNATQTQPRTYRRVRVGVHVFDIVPKSAEEGN